MEFKINNTFGIARTLLAIGTLLTLLLNSNMVLFSESVLNQKTNFSQSYGIFYLLKDNLILAKIISITFLTVIA